MYLQEKELTNKYKAYVGQFNQETALHSKNVAHICKTIAPELNLDKYTAYKIGLLHDLGKIYIPSRVLRKNGKLSDLDRMIIDLHSFYGYHILSGENEPDVICLPVLFHHGLWKPKLCYVDDKNVTDEIFEYIYMIHSVDIFEAMSVKRVYHAPQPLNVILDVLENDWMCPEHVFNAIKNYATNESNNSNVKIS